MTAIDYATRIPNNVAIADDRRLRRALERGGEVVGSGSERVAHIVRSYNFV